MFLRKLSAVVSISGLLVLAPAHAQEGKSQHDHGDLRIEAPWIRASVPGQTNGAGYLVIRHRGSRDDRLLAVRSDAAERVELHTHLMENGMARMRKVDAIDVAAGKQTALAPGGLHIMFLQLKAPFKEGETVAATLQFEQAGEVPVRFTVQPATYRPAGQHGKSGQHDHGGDHGHSHH